MSTLTVYQCKTSKNVFVLSTLHRTVAIGNVPNKDPETVHYYNSTKCGVDIVDQMARKYSTKAGSHRWLVRVFLHTQDMAAINASIQYREVTGKHISWRDFILQIAVELQQHYKQRGNNHPSREDDESDDDFEAATISKRRQCQVMKCKCNKTSEQCHKCKLAVCGKCTNRTNKKMICSNCT